MRIGMGGSAASSMATGANAAELDFDSVQRGNPEIERRAQEVINHCWAAGRRQPDPGDPRRGRGRPVQRLPRADQRRRPRCALRSARGAAGGVRPGAQGNLVQREPGALRAGASRPSRWRSSRPSASASAARSRWSAWPPRSGNWCWWTKASETPCRHAHGRAAGQAAQDAPRREDGCARVPAAGPDRRGPAKGRDRRAEPPHRGLQALPDHHRRPHRGRPDATATRWSAPGRCRWPTAP